MMVALKLVRAFIQLSTSHTSGFCVPVRACDATILSLFIAHSLQVSLAKLLGVRPNQVTVSQVKLPERTQRVQQSSVIILSSSKVREGGGGGREEGEGGREGGREGEGRVKRRSGMRREREWSANNT